MKSTLSSSDDSARNPDAVVSFHEPPNDHEEDDPPLQPGSNDSSHGETQLNQGGSSTDRVLVASRNPNVLQSWRQGKSQRILNDYGLPSSTIAGLKKKYDTNNDVS